MRTVGLFIMPHYNLLWQFYHSGPWPTERAAMSSGAGESRCFRIFSSPYLQVMRAGERMLSIKVSPPLWNCVYCLRGAVLLKHNKHSIMGMVLN